MSLFSIDSLKMERIETTIPFFKTEYSKDQKNIDKFLEKYSEQIYDDLESYVKFFGEDKINEFREAKSLDELSGLETDDIINMMIGLDLTQTIKNLPYLKSEIKAMKNSKEKQWNAIIEEYDNIIKKYEKELRRDPIFIGDAISIFRYIFPFKFYYKSIDPYPYNTLYFLLKILISEFVKKYKEEKDVYFTVHFNLRTVIKDITSESTTLKIRYEEESDNIHNFIKNYYFSVMRSEIRNKVLEYAAEKISSRPQSIGLDPERLSSDKLKDEVKLIYDDQEKKVDQLFKHKKQRIWKDMMEDYEAMLAKFGVKRNDIMVKHAKNIMNYIITFYHLIHLVSPTYKLVASDIYNVSIQHFSRIYKNEEENAIEGFAILHSEVKLNPNLQNENERTVALNFVLFVANTNAYALETRIKSEGDNVLKEMNLSKEIYEASKYILSVGTSLIGSKSMSFILKYPIMIWVISMIIRRTTEKGKEEHIMINEDTQTLIKSAIVQYYLQFANEHFKVHTGQFMIIVLALKKMRKELFLVLGVQEVQLMEFEKKLKEESERLKKEEEEWKNIMLIQEEKMEEEEEEFEKLINIQEKKLEEEGYHMAIEKKLAEVILPENVFLLKYEKRANRFIEEVYAKNKDIIIKTITNVSLNTLQDKISKGLLSQRFLYTSEETILRRIKTYVGTLYVQIEDLIAKSPKILWKWIIEEYKRMKTFYSITFEKYKSTLDKYNIDQKDIVDYETLNKLSPYMVLYFFFAFSENPYILVYTEV